MVFVITYFGSRPNSATFLTRWTWVHCSFWSPVSSYTKWCLLYQLHRTVVRAKWANVCQKYAVWMLVSPSENTRVSSTVPGIVLSTGDSEKISIYFLFGHLLYFVNSSFELFFTSDFFSIFFASILIYSIITSCVSHCNNQQVSKLFFAIYVSDKLIIVLRYGTV